MKTEKNDELALILLAAGSSTRFGTGQKKEYLKLNGGTVLSNAADVFLQVADFSTVLVTFPKDETEETAKNALFESDIVKNAHKNGVRFLFVCGGKTRQESVFFALKKLPSETCIVLIHDGARPFVSQKIVKDTIEAAKTFGAAAPAIPPVDTQKKIDKDKKIAEHLVRADLVCIQTPQAFDFGGIFLAHQKAREIGAECTDDTEIWDRFSNRSATKIVEGSAENRKITYRGDFEKMEIRTGLGYDKHALVSGRRLVLGGVEIPSDLGEAGHSDGDALLHAITDSILGAAGIGDIGEFFPPNDEKWKDADSRTLLEIASGDVFSHGWKIMNIDCVVALEKPKFLPYRQKVREEIAKILKINVEQIFVKAKTGEKLGDVGQMRAVEVWATCLLSR